MSRLIPVLVLTALTVLATPASAQPFRSVTHKPKVEIAWNRLYTGEQLIAQVHRLIAAYPTLLSIEVIGRSSQGRPLHVVKVHNPRTGPERGKAAMFIDANIHGNEVQGGEVCLYTLWYLMTYYGRLPAITRLVDERVFYVQPVTNVDARAWWFSKPATANWPRGALHPVDDDGDGRADEDGYDDLDGDGTITQMRQRVTDGRGTHRVSASDPRVMVRVRADERGDYRMLGSEGIDNDGDGRVNEDLPGGDDMNRNWPSDWQPRYVQWGAGDYPLSHPETRAVASYVLDRPWIASYQSYHNAGGMILRGPGGRDRSNVYPPADIAVYDRIGKAGERMLPFYRYLVIWKDLYPVHGGEVTWAAEGLGVISFTNELWTRDRLRARRGRPAPAATAGERRLRREASDLERLEWTDRLMFGEPLSEWKPFDHPTLGKVEIGGRRQTWGRVPPTFLMEEMLHRNAAFSLFHAEQMPKVELGPVTVRPRGPGLFEVEAEARNVRLIPTRTARMRARRIGRRDLFSLTGAGLEVIAGGRLSGQAPLRWVPVEHAPARLWFDDGIGSHGRVRVRWLVRGEGDALIRFDAEKGGVGERKVTLANPR